MEIVTDVRVDRNGVERSCDTWTGHRFVSLGRAICCASRWEPLAVGGGLPIFEILRSRRKAIAVSLTHAVRRILKCQEMVVTESAFLEWPLMVPQTCFWLLNAKSQARIHPNRPPSVEEHEMVSELGPCMTENVYVRSALSQVPDVGRVLSRHSKTGFLRMATPRDSFRVHRHARGAALVCPALPVQPKGPSAVVKNGLAPLDPHAR